MAIETGGSRPGGAGRLGALVAGLVLALATSSCTSGPGPGAGGRDARGCHRAAATVHLVLSDSGPVPVVRVPVGGCVAVSVPRSPFRRAPTEPTRVAPGGRLGLVSDSLQPDGIRTAYYTALRDGTATLTSTVRVRTNVAVPQWSGLVIIP